MILKIQIFKWSSQRILGILDTKFNHNNRYIGRDITNKSIPLDIIAEGQFAKLGRSTLQEIIGKQCAIDHQQP